MGPVGHTYIHTGNRYMQVQVHTLWLLGRHTKQHSLVTDLWIHLPQVSMKRVCLQTWQHLCMCGSVEGQQPMAVHGRHNQGERVLSVHLEPVWVHVRCMCGMHTN